MLQAPCQWICVCVPCCGLLPGNVNAQVEEVCSKLSGMKELKGGFNMIGFSQGGQFLRAVVERCAHKLPPIHTLITLGGQHQGVANTPGCSTDLTGVAATACSAMQVLLARGAYAPWVRENIVQAQYFKVGLLCAVDSLVWRAVGVAQVSAPQVCEGGSSRHSPATGFVRFIAPDVPTHDTKGITWDVCNNIF